MSGRNDLPEENHICPVQAEGSMPDGLKLACTEQKNSSSEGKPNSLKPRLILQVKS